MNEADAARTTARLSLNRVRIAGFITDRDAHMATRFGDRLRAELDGIQAQIDQLATKR